MKAVNRLLFVCVPLVLTFGALGAGPRLQLESWESNGWPRIAVLEPTNRVYTLESSSNLIHWAEASVLHGREETNFHSLPYIDPKGSGAGANFYRVHATPIDFEDDWRNHVYFDDAYRNEPITDWLPETRWIKFAIQTNEPTRVYYQNSFKYKFHYHFATLRLPAFRGLTPAQFDALSLRTNSQKIVLGAVLFSPNPGEREVGIQFVGQDPYPPEDIARWFEIVRSTIHPLGELNVRYFPTFEQAAVAENHRPFFAVRGIEIGSLTEWDTGANAYSTGWAAGRLVFVPGGQIAEAYANGTLKPDDILLTDSVPAEIPYVAGILTLAPTTPNSHVAILARSYFIPFVYLAEPELRAQAQALVGRDVAVTAFRGFPTVVIRLIDLSGVDSALREEIADAKRPPPLEITPKARFGSYTAPTEGLVPADIQYFGGKAANFGFLRREIPTNSPQAIAISFDLWDDFMSQTVGGMTLREQISSRLNRYSYPPDVAQLRADLAVIRDLIEDETSFTAAQQQAIVAALLGRFEPQTKIRFRSSTNVEDAENFTGAGLYDSYSGCLADDQDGDSNGPSVCDPTENNERGVFRAIRKVYASFYNDNAVLERLRHSVDESKVGMAILVHYSAPDPTEMANGVATINYTRNSTSSIYDGQMVTQKGAVSVTNPDGSALPEIMAVSRSTGDIYLTLKQGSTLVPLGGRVLSSDAEYKSFANLFSKIANAFQSYYPGKNRFTLDFEYKKLVPGELHAKQVREIPQPDPNVTSTTFLLNDSRQWEVFQSEYGTVFGNHRLKGLFQLQARDVKLTTNALQQSILRNVSVDYVLDGARRNLNGDPVSFSGYTHSLGSPDGFTTPVTDSWTIAGTNNHQRTSLVVRIRTKAKADESPLITLADSQIELRAIYSNAVPVVEFGAQTNFVNEESVLLRTAQTNDAQSVEQSRVVIADKGAAIRVSFYWPEPPSGAGGGYTAPLVAWKETRIEGITTEPIVLRDYFSQTYRPEHHNFSENFLFEPALEPGISPAILAELSGKDIRQIYLYYDAFDDERTYILVAGANGHFRPLAGKTTK